MTHLVSGPNPFTTGQPGVYALRHSSGHIYFGSDCNMRQCFANWASRLPKGEAARPALTKRMSDLSCAREDWTIQLLHDYTNEPVEGPLSYAMWQRVQAYIAAAQEKAPDKVLNVYQQTPRGAVARALKTHNMAHTPSPAPKGQPRLSPNEDIELVPAGSHEVPFTTYLTRAKLFTRSRWPTTARIEELRQKWVALNSGPQHSGTPSAS